MEPTFEEQRQEVRNKTRAFADRAYLADRQARDRVRKVRAKQNDWPQLSNEEKAQEIKRVEGEIMQKRTEGGQDADSKITAVFDDEASALEAINMKEKEWLMKHLGGESLDKTFDELPRAKNEMFSHFESRVKPPVLRLEREILIGGAVRAGVSQDEIDEFAKAASNPEEIRRYLEGGSNDKSPDRMEIANDRKDSEDELEVIISDDDEDEDEEKDDEDWIKH
ncbi:hypothetical protein B7494_g8514 [Chlorociboria aeruginascens]|nr:hypothetical protein B7494_g8514 [Chlorociboria aeruginascens]